MAVDELTLQADANLADQLFCDSLAAQKLFSSELQKEVDSLLLQPMYRTAWMSLDIWSRQVTLTLPASMLASIILHCHTTTLTTNTMKPWQIVKKVWGTLAEEVSGWGGEGGCSVERGEGGRCWMCCEGRGG